MTKTGQAFQAAGSQRGQDEEYADAKRQANKNGEHQGAAFQFFILAALDISAFGQVNHTEVQGIPKADDPANKRHAHPFGAVDLRQFFLDGDNFAIRRAAAHGQRAFAAHEHTFHDGLTAIRWQAQFFIRLGACANVIFPGVEFSTHGRNYT